MVETAAILAILITVVIPLFLVVGVMLLEHKSLKIQFPVW
jgi:hypothetical protein